MSNSESYEIAIIAPPSPNAPTLSAGRESLLDAFLGGRRSTTWEAYSKDLRSFARFLNVASESIAAELLVSLAPADANRIVLSYKNTMITEGLAPATIGRRLSTLRSMCKLARTLGRITWTLEVEPPRVEGIRDTAGPGDVGWRAMLDLATAEASTGDRAKIRDLAIIRTLHDLGLRRFELTGTDLDHFDRGERRLSIRGKARTAREWLTVPTSTAAILDRWIDARGAEPGPMFIRLDPLAAGLARLSDRSIHRIIAELGRRAGLDRPTWPHAIRHLSITTALDRTNGDVRAVQKFSRHKKLDILMVYDDNRRDEAGRIAALVAGD